MDVSSFIYTVLLRPKPLRNLANRVIRSVIPPRLNVRGATVVLNPEDPVVSGALTFRVYERAETKFFCSVRKPGMTFLDIGANVGYYTALALAHIGNGTVIAMEPDPDNFRYLQQTIDANHGRHTIAVQKAAGSEAGFLTLYRSSSNRGDNRLYPHAFSESSTRVEVCTVDGLLAEHGIASVDLIKIDVQGFEGHVLAGMKQTLRQPANLILLMEFWPFGLKSAGTDPLHLLAELEQAGLRLYQLNAKGKPIPVADKNALIAGHPGRDYANIVAVRGEV
jgi:FkbM family methyltransferase